MVKKSTPAAEPEIQAPGQQVATQGASLPAVAANYAVMKRDISAVAEILKSNLGASGRLDQFTLDRIKVPAGGGQVWTIPTLDGPVQDKEVEGIVIAWNEQRGYWSQSFGDSGGGTPPDCASRDSAIGIGDPGGSCLSCPLAKFGSAEKKKDRQGKEIDSRGQACKQTRLLFVLFENAMIPTVVAVPPTSLKAAGQYFLRLASHSIPYYGVKTRFTLLPDKNADGIQFSKIDFAMTGRLNAEESAKAKAYGEMFRPAIDAVAMQASDVNGNQDTTRE